MRQMHVITKTSALVLEMVKTDIHSMHKNPIWNLRFTAGAVDVVPLNAGNK